VQFECTLLDGFPQFALCEPLRLNGFEHLALENATGDAVGDNRLVWRSNSQQIRQQLINFRKAVVPDDAPLLPVKHANALRQIAERGVEAGVCDPQGILERELKLQGNALLQDNQNNQRDSGQKIDDRQQALDVTRAGSQAPRELDRERREPMIYLLDLVLARDVENGRAGTAQEIFVDGIPQGCEFLEERIGLPPDMALEAMLT
jgi:hypothetical protein